MAFRYFLQMFHRLEESDSQDGSSSPSEGTNMEITSPNPSRTPSNNHKNNQQTTTLPDILVQKLPDAGITAPEVIILGAQSSGKTKMIISLLFYHLIDNPHFTTAMGESLLKLFRTGRSMVTRRPTSVLFIHASDPTVCNVSLSLEDITVTFGSEDYDLMIEYLLGQYHEDSVFKDPLIIRIEAHSLPNIQFTDMPGLTTEDRCFYESKLTVREMILTQLANPNNTIVVVEPASVEDAATSLITPLVRRIRQESRSDILDHAVLVLSKCDRITPQSFREVANQIIHQNDQQSANHQYLPYRHIVGVINKFDGDPEVHELSYEQFATSFALIKERERQYFEQFQLDFNIHCSSKAVLHCMDEIFYNSLKVSLENGAMVLAEQLNKLQEQYVTSYAPAKDFYYVETQLPSSTMFSLPANSIVTQFMNNYIDEFKRLVTSFHVQDLQLASLWEEELKAQEYHDLMDFVGISFVIWTHKLQPKIFATFETFYAKLMNLTDFDQVKLCEQQDIKSPYHASNTLFHRIDRFPELCQHISKILVKKLDDYKQVITEKLWIYLDYEWSVQRIRHKKLLKQRLIELTDEIYYLIWSELSILMFQLKEKLLHFKIEENWLVEDASFVHDRNIHQLKLGRVHYQYRVLNFLLTLTHDNLLINLTHQPTITNDSNIPFHITEEESIWSQAWSKYVDQLAERTNRLNNSRKELMLSQQQEEAAAARIASSSQYTKSQSQSKSQSSLVMADSDMMVNEEEEYEEDEIVVQPTPVKSQSTKPPALSSTPASSTKNNPTSSSSQKTNAAPTSYTSFYTNLAGLAWQGNSSSKPTTPTPFFDLTDNTRSSTNKRQRKSP